ncbi:hypothetical protein KBD18_01720 [Patescibacteria group bacterium]|nr:hypothetical protein [Patescibacteria group bacterium]
MSRKAIVCLSLFLVSCGAPEEAALLQEETTAETEMTLTAVCALKEPPLGRSKLEFIQSGTDGWNCGMTMVGTGSILTCEDYHFPDKHTYVYGCLGDRLFRTKCTFGCKTGQFAADDYCIVP